MGAINFPSRLPPSEVSAATGGKTSWDASPLRPLTQDFNQTPPSLPLPTKYISSCFGVPPTIAGEQPAEYTSPPRRKSWLRRLCTVAVLPPTRRIHSSLATSLLIILFLSFVLNPRNPAILSFLCPRSPPPSTYPLHFLSASLSWRKIEAFKNEGGRAFLC